MHHSATAGSLLAVFVLPPFAAAQIQSKLETATPHGVYATQADASEFKFAPRGVAIPKSIGFGVAASVRQTFWSSGVSFAQSASDVVTVDWSQQGASDVRVGTGPAAAGTTPSDGPTPVPGPHALLLTLKGPPGSRGLIKALAGGGPSSDTPIPGGFELDIGNDNRFEFQAPLIGYATASFAVRFPASGFLELRLQAHAAVTQTRPGWFVCKSYMSVSFIPAPLCMGIPYGSSCGPDLTGRGALMGTDYVFDVAIDSSAANAPGLLVAGMDRIEVRIPGIHCPLLTTPLLVLPYSTNVHGQRILQFRFPQSVELDLRVQVADLGRGGARASNGLHIACLR